MPLTGNIYLKIVYTKWLYKDDISISDFSIILNLVLRGSMQEELIGIDYFEFIKRRYFNLTTCTMYIYSITIIYYELAAVKKCI